MSSSSWQSIKADWSFLRRTQNLAKDKNRELNSSGWSFTSSPLLLVEQKVILFTGSTSTVQGYGAYERYIKLYSFTFSPKLLFFPKDFFFVPSIEKKPNCRSSFDTLKSKDSCTRQCGFLSISATLQTLFFLLFINYTRILKAWQVLCDRQPYIFVCYVTRLLSCDIGMEQQKSAPISFNFQRLPL